MSYDSGGKAAAQSRRGIPDTLGQIFNIRLVFAPILSSFFRSDRDIDPDPLAFVFVNGS